MTAAILILAMMGASQVPRIPQAPPVWSEEQEISVLAPKPKPKPLPKAKLAPKPVAAEPAWGPLTYVHGIGYVRFPAGHGQAFHSSPPAYSAPQWHYSAPQGQQFCAPGRG